MFLFIFEESIFLIESFRFKYISCSYLSDMKNGAGVYERHSNTSHVLIYRKGAGAGRLYLLIQIHLMFLFIMFANPENNGEMIFKYISCSYLSKTRMAASIANEYSNTSHVLIYRETKSTELGIQVIQIHLMFLFIRKGVRDACKNFLIQIHLMFLFIYKPKKRTCAATKFKYISCSYLSFPGLVECGTHYYSNTSHVLIYRESKKQS